MKYIFTFLLTFILFNSYSQAVLTIKAGSTTGSNIDTTSVLFKKDSITLYATKTDLKNFKDSVRTAIQINSDAIGANLIKERNDSALFQSFINTILSKLAAKKSVRLVVLGASSAVGTGSSTFSNSWVGRLASYVKSLNAADTVIDLAVSTHTTYNELPTGSTVQNGKPSVDTSHNITKALSLAPDVIIIDVPSNDAASNYSLTSETEANIQVIVNAANNANIPIYVTTSVSRNNMTSSQMASLMGLRDWVTSSYGNLSLDFWNPVANPDGTINTAYSAGDGVNMNDAGHAILFSKVQKSASFIGSYLGVGDVTPATVTSSGLVVRYNYVSSPSTSFVDAAGNRTVSDVDNNYGHGGTDTIQRLIAGTDGIYYIKGQSKGAIIYFGKSATSNYWGQGLVGINLDGGPGGPFYGLVNGNRGVTTTPAITIDANKFYGIRRQSGVWQMVTSADEVNWTIVKTLSPTNVDGDLYASFDILGSANSVLYHPYYVGLQSYPTINVGADKVLSSGSTNTSVSATSTQYNGTVLSYSWTLVSGPNTPTILSPSSASTSITGMIAGAYVFKCTATGTGGLRTSANINVTVAGAYTSIGHQMIDFGVNGAPTNVANWTNITDVSNPYSPIAISDIQGSTGLSIVLPNTNLGWFQNPTNSSTAYAGTATGDYMLVRSPFAMTIHGLNPANRYDFTFYSSVSSTDTTTRGTGYTIGSTTVGMEVTNNVNNKVTISDVVPNSSGDVIINVGAFGSNTANMYSIGVLDINVKM